MMHKMKKMKQITFFRNRLMTAFLGLLLISSQSVSAQNDTLNNLPQFLLHHFDSSIVKLKTGEFSKAFMNYNTLTEKMAFYQKGSVLDLIRPENVDTVYIGERVFIPFEKVFYEVILKDRISFFIQHKSDLISKGRPAALGTTSQTSGINSVSKMVGPKNSYNLKLPEEFDIKPYKIYWIMMNDKMQRFMNERQLLNIFPEKKDQLKDFIKKSDLNLTNPDDLIEIATFCNKVMI